jgi:hypothetical protein
LQARQYDRAKLFTVATVLVTKGVDTVFNGCLVRSTAESATIPRAFLSRKSLLGPIHLFIVVRKIYIGVVLVVVVLLILVSRSNGPKKILFLLFVVKLCETQR